MNPVWLIMILLLLATYFAGIVISFNSSNKIRFELELNQNALVSKYVSLFFRTSHIFIIINKLGYLISIGFLSFYLIQYIHPGLSVEITAFPFQIASEVLIIIIIIIFCELLARTLFVIDANNTLKLLSIPTTIIYILLFPIAWMLTNCVKLLVFLKWEGKTPADFSLLQKQGTSPKLSEIPARNNKNNANSQEIRIFQKALVFSSVRIRDCMIPRTEIEAININAGIEELREKVINTGYSKIIVFRNSIDNIVGYVNAKELYKNPATIKEKLNPITFVPETMQANKLLHDFMQFHRSVAVVVDEYGGTSGLVTLEDIMEEIFGEIEDEHDTDDLVERQINPHEFVLSSRLEIEYLNSTYSLKIPESEEYDTLAGFILFHHQNLPKTNTIVKIEPFVFKILRVSNTRIELVHLEVKDE